MEQNWVTTISALSWSHPVDRLRYLQIINLLWNVLADEILYTGTGTLVPINCFKPSLIKRDTSGIWRIKWKYHNILWNLNSSCNSLLLFSSIVVVARSPTTFVVLVFSLHLELCLIIFVLHPHLVLLLAFGIMFDYLCGSIPILFFVLRFELSLIIFVAPSPSCSSSCVWNCNVDYCCGSTPVLLFILHL